MRIESPSLMEPLLPESGNQTLENLAIVLIEKANRLTGSIHPQVSAQISHLIRSMNCYYSNLIEGHDTHPRDIERALHKDFSRDVTKRNLQLEAKAHIDLQKKIDKSDYPMKVVSVDFICWLHKEFCSQLPEELLWAINPDSHKKVKVIPGEFREQDVIVGKHVPPDAQSLPKFMKRFVECYDPSKLSRLYQIIAVAASHHRLLWVHPFLDGNGRVARLFSYAYLKDIGVGDSLWSIARGLARNIQTYREMLMVADEPRRGDLDGRGNLSAAGLNQFCQFFLETCIDQINFMSTLLEPQQLLNRIEHYVQREAEAGELHKGSFNLLRQAFVLGEFDRGQAGTITNYKERQASTILNDLVKKGLLVSDTPKSPVRLGFPPDAIEFYFPRLYPI